MIYMLRTHFISPPQLSISSTILSFPGQPCAGDGMRLPNSGFPARAAVVLVCVRACASDRVIRIRALCDDQTPLTALAVIVEASTYSLRLSRGQVRTNNIP